MSAVDRNRRTTVWRGTPEMWPFVFRVKWLAIPIGPAFIAVGLLILSMPKSLQPAILLAGLGGLGVGALGGFVVLQIASKGVATKICDLV